jgi:hypothetical protein
MHGQFSARGPNANGRVCRAHFCSLPAAFAGADDHWSADVFPEGETPNHVARLVKRRLDFLENSQPESSLSSIPPHHLHNRLPSDSASNTTSMKHRFYTPRAAKTLHCPAGRRPLAVLDWIQRPLRIRLEDAFSCGSH